MQPMNTKSNYHIAGNYQGVNFSWKGDHKVFTGLIFEDEAPSTNCHTDNASLTTPPTASSSCQLISDRSVTRNVNGRSERVHLLR